MNEEGRWVTIAGRKVFIRTKRADLKEKTLLSLNPRAKGDKRMQELKEKYPNGEYSNENGVEKIALHDQSLDDELSPFAYMYNNYHSTTQQELNNMPISLNIYYTDGYGINHQSHYIYRDKSQLFKDVKTYGGLSDMTDGGKMPYTIHSESGIGEYYLDRDKFTKGGWVWQDGSGYNVNGRESADLGKQVRKRIEQHKQEREERLARADAMYDKYFN